MKKTLNRGSLQHGSFQRRAKSDLAGRQGKLLWKIFLNLVECSKWEILN